jgi:hypothetical protein
MNRPFILLCLVFIGVSCGSSNSKRLPSTNDELDNETTTIEQNNDSSRPTGFMPKSKPNVMAKTQSSTMTSSGTSTKTMSTMSGSSSMSSSSPMSSSSVTSMPIGNDTAMTSSQLLPKMNTVAPVKKDISPGRQLLYKHCLNCHEQFGDQEFFKTQAKSSYVSIAERRMPKGSSNFESSQDKKDLLNWLAKTYSAGPFVD